MWFKFGLSHVLSIAYGAQTPDFIDFAIMAFLHGSNPPLPTKKGLQVTADPFVLHGKARVYWADADLPSDAFSHSEGHVLFFNCLV